MGQKRGKAEGSFVRETRSQTFEMYGDIVQGIKAWQARPPRLREPEPDGVPETPSPEPPRFEDADVREVGDASDPLATA